MMLGTSSFMNGRWMQMTDDDLSEWYVQERRLSSILVNLYEKSPTECACFDWSSWPRTLDGNLACCMCQGNKAISVSPEQARNLGAPTIQCLECQGSGLLVTCLIFDKLIERQCANALRDELARVRNWIKETSTCKTCKGDPMKTWGGTKCEECTLEGTMPWGG